MLAILWFKRSFVGVLLFRHFWLHEWRQVVSFNIWGLDCNINLLRLKPAALEGNGQNRAKWNSVLMFLNKQRAFPTTTVCGTLNKYHYLVCLEVSGVLSATSGICLTFRRCYSSRIATNGIRLYSYFHILNWTGKKSQSVTLLSRMTNVLWTKLNGGLSGSCVASSIFYISLFLPFSHSFMLISLVCVLVLSCLSVNKATHFWPFKFKWINMMFRVFCQKCCNLIYCTSVQHRPWFSVASPFLIRECWVNEASKWWCSALYC